MLLGNMKSKMNCTLKLISLMLIFTIIGGCSVKQKAHTKQAQTATSSSTEEDTEVLKQKQLAYIKEHEQEIVDFVKAQNSKVESVQIDWDQTQWSDGGLTTPEYYMNVYGRINNIEESGWGVDIPINEDNTLNIDEMYIGSDIRVGGRLFE